MPAPSPWSLWKKSRDRTKIPPQQQKLPHNEDHIHHKSELPQRHREAEAEHIGQAGDGGGSQSGFGDQRHPKGVEKDAGDKPAETGRVLFAHKESAPFRKHEKAAGERFHAAGEKPCRGRPAAALTGLLYTGRAIFVNTGI